MILPILTDRLSMASPMAVRAVRKAVRLSVIGQLFVNVTCCIVVKYVFWHDV